MLQFYVSLVLLFNWINARLYTDSTKHLIVTGPNHWPCLTYTENSTPLDIQSAIDSSLLKSPFLDHVTIQTSSDTIDIDFNQIINVEQTLQIVEASYMMSILNTQDRQIQTIFNLHFNGNVSRLTGPNFQNITNNKMIVKTNDEWFKNLKVEWFQCS
ncbi:hypothetical protein BC833DRAFT_617822 [Globomyces pollinis-pini]|nr:hypothetical protein BC833DRAFT_617822 [Globomyces pollinis-pini]